MNRRSETLVALILEINSSIKVKISDKRLKVGINPSVLEQILREFKKVVSNMKKKKKPRELVESKYPNHLGDALSISIATCRTSLPNPYHRSINGKSIQT